MTKDEALKMALLALEMYVPYYIKDGGCKAIKACKEALEQPAQEPVAWMNDIAYSDEIDNLPANRGEIIPLYAHPAPSWQTNKEFVLLSDDEIMNIARESYMSRDGGDIKFGRAIEQALKEKNNG